MTSVTRRDRLRQELIEEIKAAARRQLSEGGFAAVSLRGIARDVGTSPAAIYNYFANLDDVFTALIVDGFEALAGAVAGAVERYADSPAQDRILAAALAYRRWALEHPAQFRLIFQDEIPGYAAPEDGPTTEATLRVALPFLTTLLEAWRTGLIPPPAEGPPVDTTKVRDRFGVEISPDEMRTAVGGWATIHGLTSLEVNHHIRADWVDPGDLFEAEMHACIRRWGFPEPTGAVGL